jgi:putative holliday junction resolvase
MPLRNLAELKAALAPGARLLGIDLGQKRIGLAISDSSLSVASPLGRIERKKLRETVAELRRLIEDRGIGGLVIGLPINMDGSEGPMAASARQFAANLEKAGIALPIAFFDERWSSAVVERDMIAADMTRSQRAKLIDPAAAAYILQGALDAVRREART